MFEIDYKNKTNKILNYIFLGILGLLIICLFLPLLKTGEKEWDDNDNFYIAYTYKSLFQIIIERIKLIIETSNSSLDEEQFMCLFYIPLFFVMVGFMIFALIQNIITTIRQDGFANNKLYLIICFMFVIVFLIGQENIEYRVFFKTDGTRLGIWGDKLSIMPIVLIIVGSINILANTFINYELFKADKSKLIKALIVSGCSLLLFIIVAIIVINGFALVENIDYTGEYYSEGKATYSIILSCFLFNHLTEAYLAAIFIFVFTIPAIILGIMQKPAIITKKSNSILAENKFKFSTKAHHFMTTLPFFLIVSILCSINFEDNQDVSVNGLLLPLIIIGAVILIVQNVFNGLLKEEIFSKAKKETSDTSGPQTISIN